MYTFLMMQGNINLMVRTKNGKGTATTILITLSPAKSTTHTMLHNGLQ